MTIHGTYRVFLTQNSEYHVRDGVCFGVRVRRTGVFAATHPALGLALAGTDLDAVGGLTSVQVPLVGEHLKFEGRSQQLITSPILSVELRDGPGMDPLWTQMISRHPNRSRQDTL